MSSVQGFSLSITASNVTSYFTTSASHLRLNSSSEAFLLTGTTDREYADAKSELMSSLYPNAAAHPTKADATIIMKRAGWVGTAYANWFLDGDIFAASTSKTSYQTLSQSNITVSNLTSSNRSSSLRFGLRITGSSVIDSRVNSATLTLYFTRYDFSASTGSGVTSASVSSSTGYDGDTVTFSAAIPTGYVFDGWYNGSTLVSASQSYTHTVNGADLALEARAHQSSHNVNGTYNGSTKAILNGISGNVTVSYNGRTATLNSSNTSHTLDCGGKMMLGNVSVGGTALQCGGKIMRSALVLNYV